MRLEKMFEAIERFQNFLMPLSEAKPFVMAVLKIIGLWVIIWFLIKAYFLWFTGRP